MKTQAIIIYRLVMRNPSYDAYFQFDYLGNVWRENGRGHQVVSQSLFLYHSNIINLLHELMFYTILTLYIINHLAEPMFYTILTLLVTSQSLCFIPF